MVGRIECPLEIPPWLTGDTRVVVAGHNIAQVDVKARVRVAGNGHAAVSNTTRFPSRDIAGRNE
jgi:hypothetical protein